jgi:hypothetical protein
MSYDSGKKGRDSFSKTRGIMGMSMGAIYLLLAVFFGFFTHSLFDKIGNTTVVSVLLGLMAAYGIFRIYRGYKIMKGEAE